MVLASLTGNFPYLLVNMPVSSMLTGSPVLCIAGRSLYSCDYPGLLRKWNSKALGHSEQFCSETICVKFLHSLFQLRQSGLTSEVEE